MAAAESRMLPGAGARVVDLREMAPGALAAVLDEEVAVWRNTLSWDFRTSANLVAQFQETGGLSGSALVVDGKAAGYSYYVTEDHKGLIGGFHVSGAAATPENEMLLLGAVLDQILVSRSIHRIESQLMMLSAPRLGVLPRRRFVHVFPRLFLEIELRGAADLAPGEASRRVTIDGWTERKQDEAASLVAASYRDHIDSEINDQYRSPGGARRFLSNIIQYPGCGGFFQQGSFLAFDSKTARLCGMCLASLVSAEAGHITQICVAPEVRGSGVGYELLRRSLAALARAGCGLATLTVTAANAPAVRLYERLGFKKCHEFAAHVWHGF